MGDITKITVSFDTSDTSRSSEEIEGIIQEAIQEAIWNAEEQFPGLPEVSVSNDS